MKIEVDTKKIAGIIKTKLDSYRNKDIECSCQVISVLISVALEQADYFKRELEEKRIRGIRKMDKKEILEHYKKFKTFNRSQFLKQSGVGE